MMHQTTSRKVALAHVRCLHSPMHLFLHKPHQRLKQFSSWGLKLEFCKKKGNFFILSWKSVEAFRSRKNGTTFWGGKKFLSTQVPICFFLKGPIFGGWNNFVEISIFKHTEGERKGGKILFPRQSKLFLFFQTLHKLSRLMHKQH